MAEQHLALLKVPIPLLKHSAVYSWGYTQVTQRSQWPDLLVKEIVWLGQLGPNELLKVIVTLALSFKKANGLWLLNKFKKSVFSNGWSFCWLIVVLFSSVFIGIGFQIIFRFGVNPCVAICFKSLLRYTIWYLVNSWVFRSFLENSSCV